MARLLPEIQLPQESVFVSPGSSIVLKAIWDQINFQGQATWMRCINNNFINIEAHKGSKYHEHSCSRNTNTFELMINDVNASDEGVYKIRINLSMGTVESKVLSLYILDDINVLGKEELNFLRYRECNTIAKEALQMTFDRYLDQSGTDFTTHLATHKSLLNSKNSKAKLNPNQLKVLYPSDGSLVSKKNLDISLLYKLLRNTTNITKPSNNWNAKPSLDSIGEGDDVERIHLYRNSIAHKEENLILSDIEFEQKWFDLTSAIDRLSKGTLRNQFCLLRNKKFQQGNITMERFYRKQHVLDTNRKCITEWTSQDILFCSELRSVEKVFGVIKNQKLVIIIGGGGSGKTATARHCGLKLQNEGWQLMPIDEIREIKSKCIEGKCVFILDDPLGSLGLDDRRTTELMQCRSTVLQLFGKENHKLIITCRTVVYNEAKPYHVFDEFNVIDIEHKDHALNNIEKRKILETYGIERLVDESSLEGANIMFPLMCYILFQNREEVLKSKAPQKVLDHRKYLLDELDTMSKSESSKVLYSSLVILMLTNNNLTDEKLKNRELLNEIFIKCNIIDHHPLSREIREKLQHSENTYVMKTEFGFKFLHDSLFEIFAFHFGQDEENQILLLKYIDIEYLANNTFTGVEGSPGRDFQVKISPNNYEVLCQRLCHTLRGIVQFNLDVRSVNAIFTHKCWSDEDFINTLLKTVGSKNIAELLLKSYSVPKAKQNSNKSKRPCSWLDKEDLLVKEKYELKGMPGVSEGGVTKFIDWIVFKGHLNILQIVLSTSYQGILWFFPRKRKIESDRLFWLSIYSMKEEMFTFALSQIKNNELERYIKTTSYHFETPLTLACSLGVFEIVKILVEKGADVAKCNEKDESPLLLAVKSGSKKIIKYLLEKCPLIKVDHERLSPFVMERESDVELLKLILENCDVLSTNHDGKTPLHFAAQEGFSDVVATLIRRGANVNAADENKVTSLHIACSRNKVEIVKSLLKAGADFHLLNAMNENPFIIALKRNSLDILQTILIESNLEEFKALLDQCPSAKLQKSSSMILYSRCNMAEVSNKLLKTILQNCPPCSLKSILEKSDVHETIFDGKTPLHIAVEHGLLDVVETVIRRGANLNARDSSFNTPLHIACVRDNINITKVLAKEGANLEVFNSFDDSPVGVAFNNESKGILLYFMLIYPYEIYKKLLEKCIQKPSVNFRVTKNSNEIIQGFIETCGIENFSTLIEYAETVPYSSNDKSPLHIASGIGLLDIVESLIQCEVPLNAIDSASRTPLHTACLSSNAKTIEIVETLAKSGARVNARDHEKQTPLHIACTLNNDKAVHLVVILIQHGANIDVTDNKNQTPLHIACLNNNTEIAAELINHLCNTSVEDIEKKIPFHIACKTGNAKLAELLYESRHLKRTDIHGKTPKCYAEGHDSVQKVFNRRGNHFQ
ncbi:uncharacterized protein LOC134273969 [Saccostrea cucullata]|uniref:uncharacterized protein LOC134273969 n=1 Tax=Saccostrea cuccullata TaxID=36930 RepID=UPI002ED41EC6